jgi:hypothetical protein
MFLDHRPIGTGAPENTLCLRRKSCKKALFSVRCHKNIPHGKTQENGNKI